MRKSKVIYAGSAAEIDPRLHSMREHMPEPSRVESLECVTAMPIESQRDIEGSFLDHIHDKDFQHEEWKKELVRDSISGAQYWGWRHVRTGVVFV